ncbi:MAG TPA: hypothetical protein VGH89_09820 [Pseudonocardia sp.]
MRILPTPSRAHGRIWAGCLVLAVAIGALAAGPSAVAAPPSPTAAGAGTQLAATAAGTPLGHVTWSVVPATSTGPDPNRLEFSYGVVKAGSTIADHVEIANRSSQSAAFSIYATDASGTSASGALLLLGSNQKSTDIGSWSSFAGGARQLSTIIPGKKAIIVAFTLKVPLQATPGDHTGAMVAAVGVTRKNAAGESVVENYRIAVPLELRVPGALRAGVQVQSISTGFSDPLNPFGTGSATVSYTLTNTGNVRQSATPTVKVTGPFGQTATVHPAKLPVILPGDSVRVAASLPGLFPAGPMTARINVEPGWPKGTIPLTLAASLATGSASLFAFPWSLLGLILLLVAIGVGLWFYFRWRRRLRRAELAAVAARARRDTEQRLLGGVAAANGHAGNGHSSNGHSANGHSADGDGTEPSAAPETDAAPAEAVAGPAEATASGGTPDGGGTAAETATE